VSLSRNGFLLLANERNLHADYEKWLEGPAPHAPTREYQRDQQPGQAGPGSFCCFIWAFYDSWGLPTCTASIACIQLR